MRIIEQAYKEKFHGDVFEEEQDSIVWQPLTKDYDSWTASCLLMAETMGRLREADLVVQEPDSQAPPTREFKIINSPGQAHFLITIPLLELFLWVNEKHTDAIHPDIVLAESLRVPATVVIDDKKGSIIHVHNGPTFIDPRTGDDRARAAEQRYPNFQRGN